MKILRLLETSAQIKDYEVQEYKQWSEGLYYKIKIIFYR